MFFRRLTSLFGGKFTRWLKTRESRDPEAVYEAAIADRVQRYQQLKTAAAGVIYMRTKLESRAEAKSPPSSPRSQEQAGQAVDINEDQCALILIRRKHELEPEVARLKDELAQLTAEAEGGQAKPDRLQKRNRQAQGRKDYDAGAIAQRAGAGADSARVGRSVLRR